MEWSTHYVVMSVGGVTVNMECFAGLTKSAYHIGALSLRSKLGVN